MNEAAVKTLAEKDRLAELAHIGAGHAAGAFASLVDRTIWTDVPVVVERASANTSEGASDAAAEAEWSTGVFFEFDGCFEALVGLLFPRHASEVLVRRVVGVPTGDLDPELIESALMEVGNILASHVASAIADTLGGRLLPSIPSLVTANAEQAMNEWVDAQMGPAAIRVETDLHDESGELRGRLIVIPTDALSSR